ncbi:hypothetical protein H0G86_008977 [Trichoderma simmonsii]|uniref:Uncharacterized protein n=1 Tax=Trichoderma simmonsii TaxID=1491479 RepID=A0A8G0LJL6_9HYPO|nr:hypothetical protein H0G86_008977 [Trichoderma simmonsii]
MPVTTWPSPFQQGRNRDPELTLNANSRAILETVTSKCVSPYENDPQRRKSPSISRSFGSFGHNTTGFRGLPIIASSIDPKRAVDAESPDKTVSVYNNGFVEGLIRAFNQDLHLVIRPDDVWQAILSQFSLFINGGRNAERLRHMFVSHKGKKELGVFFESLSQIDFEEAAQGFTSLIQQNVVDPELREWMLPNFSTTTKHDKAVAAFGMMGAMKKFFGYDIMCGCGLPSVTLLGTRDDWEMLASRVNKLNKYGDECQRWANLLQPIMRYMQRTFDEPDSQEVKDFWLRVAWETGHEGSSGDSRLISGWITAFAYFEASGSVSKDYEENTFRNFQGDRRRLILDGVSYPLIRPFSISSSLVLVPVTITDLESRTKKFSTAISGTIGMSISAGAISQPVSAWWIVQEFETPI